MTDPNGIYLIDKPSGITSHDVVDRMREITGVRRVGHAGTLDPLATGLLIVLVGREFTKKQSQFLSLDKEYLCTARFGITTDTYDITGKITHQVDWPQIETITKSNIENKMDQFRGLITQTVPAYSAIKVKGKKLYEAARKGKIINDLPKRKVQINSFELLEFAKDDHAKTLKAKFKIHCSSGTYVRSLIHDLGQFLKIGAAVEELRRTKIGEQSVNSASTLESFKFS